MCLGIVEGDDDEWRERAGCSQEVGELNGRPCIHAHMGTYLRIDRGLLHSNNIYIP